MSELALAVKGLLQKTGEAVIPLAPWLTPADCDGLFEMVRLVLGPGFGVEVKHAPRPELILWREQRGASCDA